MFTGGFELVFILFIAFLLFGPKKLPEIARILGKGLGELRRASSELRNSLEDELRALDHEVEAQKNPETAGPEHTRAHQGGLLELKNALQDGVRSLRRELAEGSEPANQTAAGHGDNHGNAAHHELEGRS